MPADPLLILGETNYRNERKRFGIKLADRRRPTVILGKTGMGKSTLLLNCIVQDIRAGNGVTVIDPHGDLTESLLDHIPSWRVNETIYFNPADTEYPIGFNILHARDPSQRQLVASGVLQVFKKIWTEHWGPRLEYVFRNALLALLENQGSTLLGVPRLLTDDRYRSRILQSVTDPVVRHFWEVEYEQYPKVFRTETISPIQNKVGQFLTNPITRNILGQTRTRFDLLDVLDSGKILLVNLSKGKIGEDTASLLGALMATQLYLAALRRAHYPEHLRRDHFLFIDETHAVATEDFPSILSEARKYRLNIAGLANQFIGQLTPSVAQSMLGNAGTIIAFSTGAEDAAILAHEFFPPFAALDLQALPQHEMYLRLSIDGKSSAPFSATTRPPIRPLSRSSRTQVIAQSRQRYCEEVKATNRKLLYWYSYP